MKVNNPYFLEELNKEVKCSRKQVTSDVAGHAPIKKPKTVDFFNSFFYLRYS